MYLLPRGRGRRGSLLFAVDCCDKKVNQLLSNFYCHFYLFALSHKHNCAYPHAAIFLKQRKHESRWQQQCSIDSLNPIIYTCDAVANYRWIMSEQICNSHNSIEAVIYPTCQDVIFSRLYNNF